MTEPISDSADMNDGEKTREELIRDLSAARARIAGFEELRAEFKRVESVMRQAVLCAKEEKARTEAIIEAIGEGISVQDTGFRVLLQNDLHKKMIGEHEGELCYKAYQNRETLCEGCHLAMAFKDGRIHKQEQVRVTDRGTFYYEITASPMKDAGGRIIAGIEAVRDITDRKRAEQALMTEAKFISLEQEVRKARRLESLGRLAAGIAHEYNNVLTALSGNISLAALYATPGSEISGILMETEKAAQKAEKLTQGLQTFSRAGTLFKTRVPVAGLLSAAAAKHGRPDIRYEISVPPDLRPLEADVTQFRQAVGNILENACEAMAAGGVIRISAEDLDSAPGDLPFIRQGAYIKITISDQGSGIDENDIGKVFEPFFTTKKSGCGLGLTAAACIIEGHDGGIRVESRAGSGSSFYIYAPAASERLETGRDDSQLASPHRPEQSS